MRNDDLYIMMIALMGITMIILNAYCYKATYSTNAKDMPSVNNGKQNKIFCVIE